MRRAAARFDSERDLLDRAHAVEPMGAQVARDVDELLVREVGGGDALEDLLVGRVGRLGRAPSSPIRGLIVAPSMTSREKSEPPRL